MWKGDYPRRTVQGRLIADDDHWITDSNKLDVSSTEGHAKTNMKIVINYFALGDPLFYINSGLPLRFRVV